MPAYRSCLVVIHPDDRALCDDAIETLATQKPVMLCSGGATRQQSVLKGLEELAFLAPQIVLVHDAARPFLTSTLIDRAIAAATRHGAAVPAVPVTDTLVQIAGDMVAGNPARDSLRAVQTPQAFDYAALLSAHRLADRRGHGDYTDDGAVIRAAGCQCACV